MDYSELHQQLLYDLERFYKEQITHYGALELVADAYKVEWEKVMVELVRNNVKETCEKDQKIKDLEAGIKELEAEIKNLTRDIDDMSASGQTYFVRCEGCGRLHSQGLVCPDGSHPKCAN